MGARQSTATRDAIHNVAHNPSRVTQQDLADWDALVQNFENPTPRESRKMKSKDPTLVTGYTVEDLHAFDCLAAALEGDVGGEATADGDDGAATADAQKGQLLRAQLREGELGVRVESTD